jgi:hypothetical protein
LLEIIESLAPPGWRILVDSLPDLGPSDSKRGFKAAVERLLDTEPPEPAAGLKRVETRLPEGKLRLGILPQRTSGVEGRVIMSEPAVAAWNTSEEKIRKAIKKKRLQGRNVEIPSILAVYANGISTTFEDFDHALYGREASVLGTETPTGVLDVSGSELPTDGVFNKGEGDPTWAAVLAFVNVYLGGGVEPVLYLYPVSREICRRRSRVLSAGASIPWLGARSPQEGARQAPRRQAGRKGPLRQGLRPGTHLGGGARHAYLAELKKQTDNVRVLLASTEAELSERRERTTLTDTTHAWLLSLGRRLGEVEEATPEGFEKRKQLVGLLVGSISLGKSQEGGRAEVQITYRFGPPPAPDAESDDSFMPGLKNGSRS